MSNFYTEKYKIKRKALSIIAHILRSKVLINKLI